MQMLGGVEFSWSRARVMREKKPQFPDFKDSDFEEIVRKSWAVMPNPHSCANGAHE